MEKVLATKLVRYIEGIRREENMTVAEFVQYFDVSIMTYWKWRNAVKKGKAPNIRLSNVQRGLDALGYEAYVIIEKLKK